MKKNSLMRLAGLLLIMTLVTSCFVGGTFAKYVTDGEGMDSARVAKFGVTVTGNGTMFAKTYETEDQTFTETNSVVSSGQVHGYSNVVAPGTAGEMASVVITGTPEVAVRVSYEVTNLVLKNWEVDGEFYCPLEITISEQKDSIKGLDYNNAADFIGAIESAVKAYSKDYPAGTDLSDDDSGNNPLEISWAWAFEGDNVKDTALGNQSAENKAATIDLTITTTVTQIN